MAAEVRLSAPALLGAVDLAHGPGPGFRRLAAAIAAAVGAGDLPAGARLPPERELAAAAGVSRGSVVAAYDLLRADGIVLRRRGSGTWVRAGAGPPGPPSTELDAALRARRLTSRVVSPAEAGLVDMGLSALAEPWELDDAWFDVAAGELTRAGVGHGYLPNGVPELRDAVAAHLTSRGRPSAAEEVGITHGAQSALSSAVRLLVRPGDAVAVESPTFPGAIDVLARSGARLVPVPTDSAGVRPAELAAAVASGVRAVYLVPSCHSPTGVVMPAARREQVAAIVDRSHAWLVEDETLAALRFEGPVPTPVSAWMRSDRSVTVGSLSKEVWAGLGVGWLRSGAAVVERLGRLRAALDLGGSVHAQMVAIGALDGLEDRTDRLRAEMAHRNAALVGLVARHLPDWEVHPPEGGLSTWCRLPAPVADRVAVAAPDLGVSVLSGSSTTVDRSGGTHVRLSHALPPDRLERGVERLAGVWESLAAGPVSPPVPRRG